MLVSYLFSKGHGRKIVFILVIFSITIYLKVYLEINVEFLCKGIANIIGSCFHRLNSSSFHFYFLVLAISLLFLHTSDIFIACSELKLTFDGQLNIVDCST